MNFHLFNFFFYLCHRVDNNNLKAYNMRKLFTLLTLSTVVFAACEKGGEQSTKPKVTVTSERVIEFDAEGGTSDILYTIANGADTKVNITETAAWIDTEVEASKVVVTVKANDGLAAREANITISYYQSSAVVTVKQAGRAESDYDVEFTAKRFEGIYFGTDYSSVPNYYVILSDIGANNDGSPKANGTYYFFDMYHNTKADEASPILPNGDYAYDVENSFTNLTFSEEGSWYAVMDGNGEYSKSSGFKTAYASVKNGRFEAIIELTSGEKHHVVFEGKLQTTIGHVRSTFTEDVEFAVEDATITASLLGDSDGDGQHNWFIEAKKGDDLYMVDVFTASTESCAGLYQMMDIDGKDFSNRYLPGLIGEDGLVGSWYAKLTDGSIKGDVLAPMAEGVIQLVVEGDTMRIEYGCKDDAGNNITGSVSGKFSIKDVRE